MDSNMTTISVQIDRNDKIKVNEILDKLGISMSGLINMTLKQVILKEAIPFDLDTKNELKESRKYSKKLNKALEEMFAIAENPEKYKTYNCVDDIEKDLEDGKL